MTVVYGARTRYDLPDLMAFSNAEITIALIDPLEANGRPLTEQRKFRLKQVLQTLGGNLGIRETFVILSDRLSD